MVSRHPQLTWTAPDVVAAQTRAAQRRCNNAAPLRLQQQWTRQSQHELCRAWWRKKLLKHFLVIGASLHGTISSLAAMSPNTA